MMCSKSEADGETSVSHLKWLGFNQLMDMVLEPQVQDQV